MLLTLLHTAHMSDEDIEVKRNGVDSFSIGFFLASVWCFVVVNVIQLKGLLFE